MQASEKKSIPFIIFRWLYWLCLLALLGFAAFGSIWGFVEGVKSDGLKVASSTLGGALLFLVFAATPLSIIFFALNAWGVFIDPPKRKIYIFLLLGLAAWFWWTIPIILWGPWP